MIYFTKAQCLRFKSIVTIIKKKKKKNMFAVYKHGLKYS